jgi:hypothetical protein
LTLSEAKKGSPRFATGAGRNLQGSYRRLDEATFLELVHLLDERNRGLAEALRTKRLRRLIAAITPVEEEEVDDDEGYTSPGAFFTNEAFLGDAIRDLFDDAGWASLVDPRELGLDDPSASGYRLPSGGYVDDLLLLDHERLAVIEYERAARGDTHHGSAQVDRYRRELRAMLPDWLLCAAVIAETFNLAELQIAAELEVECLQIVGLDDRNVPVLAPKGSYTGVLAQLVASRIPAAGEAVQGGPTDGAVDGGPPIEQDDLKAIARFPEADARVLGVLDQVADLFEEQDLAGREVSVDREALAELPVWTLHTEPEPGTWPDGLPGVELRVRIEAGESDAPSPLIRAGVAWDATRRSLARIRRSPWQREVEQAGFTLEMEGGRCRLYADALLAEVLDETQEQEQQPRKLYSWSMGRLTALLKLPGPPI